MRKIDSMIIADTHWPRAMELMDFARKMPEVDPKGLSLIYADKNQEVAIGEMGRNFERMIRTALKRPQHSLVIMNYFAATQGKVLDILKAAEDEYGRQARRFIVTCKSHSKIAEGLGENRSMLHRIPYNSERMDYLEVLDSALRQPVREKVGEIVDFV